MGKNEQKRKGAEGPLFSAKKNMLKGLLGKKINMTQIFDKRGRVVPVTKIRVSPNVIVQIKNTETDGYKSAQVGFGALKKPLKPGVGHAKKSGLESPPRYLKEFQFDGDIKSGDLVTLDQVFSKNTLVDISGDSKGKGFAGVVKRWGFAGGPRTHGQSDRERAAGSIGATTTPGRVFKGLKMAGHMGDKQITVRGLEIMDINKDENELLVAGSVPGFLGSILIIKKSGKKKAAYHEPEMPVVPQVGKSKEETGENQEVNVEQGEAKETKDESKEEKPENDKIEVPEKKDNKE